MRDGRSPFWEGLGRHFFAMEYSTADYLTGIGQKAFVAELMPRHPVYVNLLPESARAVIGAVHDDTQPARALLEQEGFRYEGYVDIFDAGPTLECFRDNIHAVRQSAVLPVTLGEGDPVPDSLTDDVLWLVANRRFEDFRAVLADAPARVDRLPLLPYAAAQLGIGEGDTVRAVPLSPRGPLIDVNFDGIPGPTHNYAGLARGNLAAERNARRIANPREAALQGLAKMRALAARGFAQAVLPPHERPDVGALRALGFAGSDADVIARAPRSTRRSFSPRARRPPRCGPPTLRR